MNHFIVEQQLIQSLINNRNLTEFWTRKKLEHEKVKENLTYYLGKSRHTVMVPLGRKALMKGSLIHTNDILISIGSGYFVKKSASEAIAVADRRLSEINTALAGLETERHLLESRRSLPSGTFGENDIREEYDEDREQEWRRKHRENIKEYKKRLKEMKTDEPDEEDLWKHLDYLELQEELEDEIHRLGSSEEVTSSEEDDPEEQPVPHPPTEPEPVISDIKEKTSSSTIPSTQRPMSKFKQSRLHS